MGIDGNQQAIVMTAETERLQHQGGRDQVGSLPAELLGYRHALNAEVRTPKPRLMRESRAVTRLLRPGVKLFLREFDNRLSEQSLLFAPPKLHGARSSLRRDSDRRHLTPDS